MADDLANKLKKLQDRAGKLDPPLEANVPYVPTKRKRSIRRAAYERFYFLRDAPERTNAEADWEEADKEFGMVTSNQFSRAPSSTDIFDNSTWKVDPDDWRSNLHLPDAFSAIQTQAQETIERKARPHLLATEESDQPIQEFANAVLTYNMNNTDFDYQAFISKLNASSRGTSFRMDYWRTDKRIVKDPVSLNEDGSIKYEDKEIVDFDDDYTEWVPNEYIFIDEKAKHINEAVDMFRREILNIEEFHRIYDNKPGFSDTEYVFNGGDTNTKGTVFKLPKDVTEQDVEILHYFNRSIDSYWVVANNVTIHDGPLPSKHKELPVVIDYQYKIPGQLYGVGIPKVLHMLSEERNSIRNLQMDRQKMQLNKMFLHNSSFDIDDEDLITRPHGLISIDTNGQDIRNAILPLEYGDIPGSSFKTDEGLLEDIRRATGIDDRISVSNSATTATQAAIVKESTLKRINLISIANEMDSVIRLGKIKWSNIQFFYGTPRLNNITKDNEDRQEKVYRTMNVQGKKFAITNEPGEGKQLSMEDIKGSSALTLKPEMAKYMEGSFDITVDADIFTPISKAIEQTKKTEMFSLMLSNPATMAVMDISSAAEDVLAVNNIKPDKWLKDPSNTHDMMMLAESENMVMSAGQPLNGTENATEEHTLVHLMYTKSEEFGQLAEEVQQIISDHIMQEHDNNPATGSSADAAKSAGLGIGGAPPPPGGGGGMPMGGAPLPPPSIQANTSQPQAQTADLQPTNFSKA